MRYGFTYMGSKSDIAEDLTGFLPSGKRFVDLFGGGGAMSHCACLSRKWDKVLYNEFNPLCADLFRCAVKGEIDGKKWINRATFHKNKTTDGYIAYCWSFGCRGQNYMYSKEFEPWKKALHYARVLNDTSLFEKMGIHTDGSRKDIKAHKEEYKELYIKWYLKNVMLSEVDFNKLKSGLERLQSLESLEIRCGDYRDYEYKEGDVVYCDPPYEGTAEYVDSFNSAEFYKWVHTRPYQVFFSSYEISDKGFYKVWSKKRNSKFQGGNGTERIEVLYSNKPYFSGQMELF